MQDPNESDRQEILTGPGDVRLAQRNATPGHKSSKNTKKTAVIAAAVLAAVLAAGGAGYMLAANPGTPATQDGSGRPAPSQSAGGDETFQDDDATMGDAATDAPEDGSMGDAKTDTDTGAGPADPGPTGTDSSRGTAQTGTGKNPATSSPTKPPQSPVGDNPADGPAGEVGGQCATGGC
ncbi:hypothetical protein ACTMTI_07960 [Nonomuraea sp. H19]|uniref:hypothetical protein n=1 Tax=Nonomuraea sp. H19 TaxID=3452206 RepID=UPI003F8A63EF